jgi:membrane fusion protein (multidrug efflux system)
MLTLTGNVVADQSSNVTASVPGKVIAVLVDRGDVVKFGQPLVRLDAQSAALQSQSVRAQLGAQQAQEKMAQEDCKRAQALLDKGAITQSQYEKEMTGCTAAQQTVAATRAQLELIGKSIADGVVRAPFAGEISERFVSPGEWAGPGMRLVTLVDADPLTVELSVPERWVPRLAVGQEVAVSAIAYPEQQFPAMVTRIGAEIGRQTRALTVEAQLAPGSSLRPGMFAEARLKLGDKPMAVVPKSALVQRGSTWRLFVVVKGHLEERVVQRGPELPGGKVALLRGAVAGEKVAAAISERVIDGVRVE